MPLKDIGRHWQMWIIVRSIRRQLAYLEVIIHDWLTLADEKEKS